MLTERLDHHRNQGKQQIVVQHTTTVNADQAAPDARLNQSEQIELTGALKAS